MFIFWERRRQLPTTIPSVGGWNSNDTVVYDTSFPSANWDPIIRCTDAFTETSHPYFSFAGGQGGSGNVGSLVNTNSTALHVNDQGGRGFLLNSGQGNCRGDLFVVSLR
ncbi:MAG: hypothetical protein JWQ87_934 [Candidatus Sulfotelmatobacter sp.]|nr:hypothetical protein [Candidatus Sulfotelmatobacter sp.]